MSTSDKWDKEKKAAKAVQVAFDLGQEVSHHIRYEALEKGINPPDRIREILGLPVNSSSLLPINRQVYMIIATGTLKAKAGRELVLKLIGDETNDLKHLVS